MLRDISEREWVKLRLSSPLWCYEYLTSEYLYRNLAFQQRLKNEGPFHRGRLGGIEEIHVFEAGPPKQVMYQNSVHQVGCIQCFCSTD